MKTTKLTQTLPANPDGHEASSARSGCLAHCYYHDIYGCDPDKEAEMRDIYRGDQYFGRDHLCQPCRAAFIFAGYELIVPENE